MENQFCKHENLMIIDTDAGSDDAMALIMSLNSPNWKVIAITTVFGNIDVDIAYENALRILNLCDQTDIVVYEGSRSSLVYPTESDYYHGQDGLGGNAHLFPMRQDVIKPEEHAANALVRLIKQHPKQITLVAIGPLTNLAIAHKLDPNFSSNLKDIMIMGGNILGQGNVTPCAEFNFLCDAEAANIVLREFTTDIQIMPWETTANHLSSWDWYERWTSMGTKKSDFAAKSTSLSVSICKNVSKRAGFNCCDLLAITVKMHPQLLTKKERRHVQVETVGKLSRGMMIVEWRDHLKIVPNVEICLEINIDGARKIWEEILK